MSFLFMYLLILIGKCSDIWKAIRIVYNLSHTLYLDSPVINICHIYFFSLSFFFFLLLSAYIHTRTHTHTHTHTFSTNPFDRYFDIYGTRWKHKRTLEWTACGGDLIIGVNPKKKCLSSPSFSVLGVKTDKPGHADHLAHFCCL